MKIIVEGDKTRLVKTVRFTCERCGCVFEADEDEYAVTYGYRNDTWYEISCPCCGQICCADR